MPAVPAPIPADEAERLLTLQRYNILDTPPELAFDDIAHIAAHICDAPISLVSMIDTDRQWFKSIYGIETSEMPRAIAFCAHTILQENVFVVPNAEVDVRFAENPLVTAAPNLRFYAGAPLKMPDGHKIGTLCVVDRVPRELSIAQHDTLQALARQVVAQLELRRTVAELKEANGRLAALATTDQLTGLNNMRAFSEQLQHEYARAVRACTPLSLIMLDVDYFKTYNDTYGHLAGDLVLKAVADILSSGARRIDHVARYGGEEFVVILPNAGRKTSKIIAERLRTAIEKCTWSVRPITASFGVASMTPSIGDPRVLIEYADRALYRSKADGRNRVTVYVPQTSQIACG